MDAQEIESDLTETLVTDLPQKEQAGAGAGHDHGGGMDF